jgi:Fe-S-cluster containining protein
MIHIYTTKTGSGFPLNFNEDPGYPCLGCGGCCQKWEICIGPETMAALKDTPLARRLDEATGGGGLFHYSEDMEIWLIKKVDERCVFLDGQEGCLIHKEIGYNAKPVFCREYPIRLFPTPDGIFVGASFKCPSVLEGPRGDTCSMTDEIEAWLKEHGARLPLDRTCAFTDGITTDWEGYKAVEVFTGKCIESASTPGEGLWNAFMTMLMLSLECRRDGLESLTAERIKDFLKNPPPFPFERDEIYFTLEKQTALGLITIMETEESDSGGANFGILLNGGKLNSRTFGQPVDVGELQAYARKNMEHFKAPLIIRYLTSLIWGKIMLKRRSILGGLAQLIIITPLLGWYFFARALLRGAPHPDAQDAVFAVQLVDKSITHGLTNYAERHTQSFYESMIKQVEIMM